MSLSWQEVELLLHKGAGGRHVELDDPLGSLWVLPGSLLLVNGHVQLPQPEKMPQE